MAGLFGVETFRSEDNVHLAFKDADDDAIPAWINQQTDRTFAPLLEQEWVLDLDATSKNLYGRQEEARIGYTPLTLPRLSGHGPCRGQTRSQRRYPGGQPVGQ